MRQSTWIAVFVGGAAGAAAAVARQPLPDPSAAPEPPELRPAAAVTVHEPKSAPTSVAPAASEALPPKSSASATPQKATAEAPKESFQAPAPLTPNVGSRYELTGYEIACHENKDPSACRAAATAYEEGKVISADLDRAKLFRKIELTFLVKHCESQLPSACSDLAYRYQRGDGVGRNERTAQILLDRARELCAGRRAEVCTQLGR
jgi:hypothetical protein